MSGLFFLLNFQWNKFYGYDIANYHGINSILQYRSFYFHGINSILQYRSF